MEDVSAPVIDHILKQVGFPAKQIVLEHRGRGSHNFCSNFVLSIYLPSYLSIYLHTTDQIYHLSRDPTIYLSLCLSVCLSIYNQAIDQ